VSETVFSHESKLSLVSHAQSLGYHVVLYVVSVSNPQHLLARVRQRIQEGGHHVPARRILERYPRTMANLRKAVRLADLAFVYDGAEVERGAPTPTLVAVCKAGQTTVLVKKLPPWAAAMLATD
jgi:predicted ABC-type ATPase